MAAKTKLFSASQFTPTQWESADDKAKFAAQFARLKSLFTNRTRIPKGRCSREARRPEVVTVYNRTMSFDQLNTDIDHIDIRVYGPRNHLLGQARLPVNHVPDFRTLLEKAQSINPVYDVGLLTRWMLRSGYKAVERALRTGKVEPTPGG